MARYNPSLCCGRLVTFIIYLQSPLKGGATVFPKARPQSFAELSTAGPKGLPARSQKSEAPSAGSGVDAKGDGGAKGEEEEEEEEENDNPQRDDEVDYGGGDIWDIWWLLQKYNKKGKGKGAGPGRYRRLHGEAGEGGVAPAPAPAYCDERAGNLQVAPAPGDALLFWWVQLLGEEGSHPSTRPQRAFFSVQGTPGSWPEADAAMR